MSDCPRERPTLLVLTSTFPRWLNDNEPPFVLELCRRLQDRFRVIVLAPGAAGAKPRETIDGLLVYRYRYFIDSLQCLAYEGGILSRLRANPFNYFLVPFFVLSQLMALITILKKERVALIHAHWIIPQGLVAGLAKLFCSDSPPVLCTSHGGDLFALNGFAFSWLKRRVLASCRAVTVVSTSMKERVRQLGVAEDRIQVISMGADLSAQYTPPEKEDRNGREILFVGRLVEKKGVIDLLHAFRQVAEEYEDASLTLIGGGPQRVLLERTAQRLAIDKSVNIMGPLPASSLVEYYRRAAIAVFPFVVARDGDQEGLGLVLIEALGCRCPVVASDLAAVRDVIEHERNGLLVRPGDRNAIAAAMLRLLRQPGLAAELAARGRADVLARYDWDKVARRYADLMQGLISPAAPSRIGRQC